MPTYEYACSDCGTHVEVVQRFDDEPLTTCTRCGGRLRKVFHPAGIVFRGSGFYATDSRAAPTGDGDAAKKEPAKKEPAKKDASTASSSSTDGGAKKEKSA